MTEIIIGPLHGGTGLSEIGNSGEILTVHPIDLVPTWAPSSIQATMAFGNPPIADAGPSIAPGEIGYIEYNLPSASLLALLTQAPSDTRPNASMLCNFPVCLINGGSPTLEVEFVVGTDAVTPDFTEPYKVGYSGQAILPVPSVWGELGSIWNEAATTLRLWIKNVDPTPDPSPDAVIKVFGAGTAVPVIIYYDGFS